MAPTRFFQTALQVGCAGVLAAAIAGPTHAEVIKVDEDSPVKSILVVGEDDGKFYVVYCDNSKQGSVSEYTDPPKVCAGPPKECKSAWTLMQAAEYVCR